MGSCAIHPRSLLVMLLRASLDLITWLSLTRRHMHGTFANGFPALPSPHLPQRPGGDYHFTCFRRHSPTEAVAARRERLLSCVHTPQSACLSVVAHGLPPTAQPSRSNCCPLCAWPEETPIREPIEAQEAVRVCTTSSTGAPDSSRTILPEQTDSMSIHVDSMAASLCFLGLGQDFLISTPSSLDAVRIPQQ